MHIDFQAFRDGLEFCLWGIYKYIGIIAWISSYISELIFDHNGMGISTVSIIIEKRQ